MDTNTAQQKVREQYKVAENTLQNMYRAWNDLALTTSEAAFDAFSKNVRYSQELYNQSERVARETFSIYRNLYQDGVRSWEGYVQSVNHIVTREN